MPLRPMATARAMSAETWVRDCRKLSASRVWILMVMFWALAVPYCDASRRFNTRSPFCRMAGTSSGLRPAQAGAPTAPPPCMRGAFAKAMAGTMRCGAVLPIMPPACRTGAKMLPRLPSAPDRALASGPRMNFRADSLARSASIEVTSDRKSSLPVLTNSPMAFSALVKAPTRASPMPLPTLAALVA